MKRSMKALIGYTIGATNGEIGKIKDFFFDDKTWTIRYLIVETGNWISGRKILIAPKALLTPDEKKEVFPVNLTMGQVRNSPNINTELPVSRQNEMKWNKYYSWTNYWNKGVGTSGMMMQVEDPIEEAIHNNNNTIDEVSINDPDLRSAQQVAGYSINSNDGTLGKVEDFIIDDSSWKIDWIVVNIGNWFAEKKVLISSKTIKEIKWQDSTVAINESAMQLKDSPEYNLSQFKNEA